MKVLVACEESQEVSKAFRALGHEAYSCDIQEPSGGHPEWHILGDVLEVLNPDIRPLDPFGGMFYGIYFYTMNEQPHYMQGKWEVCNYAKSDMSQKEFILWAKRVANHTSAMAEQWGGDIRILREAHSND